MIVKLTLAATAAIAAGCGAGDAGDWCTAAADCGGGLYCSGPDEPNVCGIGARQLCASDDDCTDGMTCHAVFDACSPDELGSECMPPCDPGGCNAGLECTDGACLAIACDVSGSCAPFEICDPSFAANTPIYERNDGCRPIDCGGAAGDCPGDSLCVNGVCQSGAGTCREDVLVP